MCGISGVMSSSKVESADLSLIRRIVKLQKRRGPDHSGVQRYDHCILGHNRLKILDLSAKGNQPMETRRFSIVFNGEIYNYKNLRSKLEDTGVKFDGDSDTEVLLRHFHLYGLEDTLSKINGMFAIALYDKIDNKLHLIRDRLGIKPLYYFIDAENKKIYFASNLKSIFLPTHQMLQKKWSINYEAIYKYLLLGGCWEGETIVNNIYKLGSATTLTIDKDFIINVKKYWKPKFRKDKDSAEHLGSLIKSSILLRKKSDVPTSVLFSGGIDSGTIAYFMKNSICIYLKNREEEYAKKTAEELGVKLVVMNEESDINCDDLLEHVKKYIYFSGEPSKSCTVPMVTLEEAKSLSTVVLSGNGGDEVFYGYHRTPRIGIFRAGPSEQYHIAHMFRHPQSVKVRGVNQYSLEKLTEMVYDNDLEEGFGEEAKYRWAELNNCVKNELNPTLDYASMYYGLEARVPFLDHRLVEAALSYDHKSHISNAASGEAGIRRKTVQKNILSNKMSEEFINRKKVGFSLPGSLNEAFRGHVGEEYVNKLLDRGIIEHVDYSIGIEGRNSAYLKNACVSLELWMQEYVDTGIIEE